MRRLIAAVAVVLLAACAPVAHAATWTPRFQEDFNTPAALGQFNSVYGQKFDNYDGWTDTSGHGTYSTAQTLSVHDGVLDIWLHSTRDGGQWKHWVAALIPKWPCGGGSCSGITYGYVRTTFSVAPNPPAHYKTAWLMWPDSNQWPQGGEIDFPESCSDLTGQICFATHPAQSDPTVAAVGSTGVRYTDSYIGHPQWGSYHVSEMLWYPDHTEFWLDGVYQGAAYGEPGYPVPSSSMHHVLQTETETGGQPAPSNSAAGHVYVDDLEIWDYTP